MLTFGQLKAQLRAIIFPAGEAENLIARHDASFLDAMIDLQRWVECYQRRNTNVYPFCTTLFECGRTIIDDAPRGRIKRLYTIAGDEWCSKIYYLQREYADVENWSRNLLSVTAPTNDPSKPALPQGYRYANKSTDAVCGRGRDGIWAIHRSRIYVTPWIQSNETVVIEWEGIKREWKDEDPVEEGPDFRRAVQNFVLMDVTLQDDCDDRKALFYKAEYEAAKADLIHECREETRVRKAEKPSATTAITERGPTQDELDAEVVADEEEVEVVFAEIADFGKPTESAGIGLRGVAEMIASWNPDFVLTAGDNIYAPTNTYQSAVGDYYGDFITDDLTTTRFFPIAGNHDHSDPANGFDDYLAYFTLPGNERYYELVRGPVHFFMLHSAIGSLGAPSPEPDGVEATSKQAQWLKARMSVSTARWKVVLVHDSPYCLNEDYPGHTVLRWPYKLWGADVVISGDDHRYERYEVDGLPYLVNGLGGATRDTNPHVADVLAPYLKASYHADWGAIRGTATCDSLKFEFITRGAVTVDTLTLTKD